MLKENAGTPNEGRRDTKTNVEGVGKTRSEDKRDTKTKVEESRTQGTALCVGLIRPRSVWNSGVYEGGPIIESWWRRRRYSNGNTKRSPMDVGVGTKRRIQNPKCKHDTEGRRRLFRTAASSTPVSWSFGMNFVTIRRPPCGLHVRLSRVG